MRKIGLKKIRESLMISKTELARMANISPMTISRIEQGFPCRRSTQRKVALALEETRLDTKNVILSFDTDKKENRLGLDRRQFSYDTHIPERRSEKDRRNGRDGKLKPQTKK
jgi:DNA-binding XRE family transcriptional regulator